LLNKKNKLTNADEFSSVFSTKNRLASPHFFYILKAMKKKNFALAALCQKKLKRKLFQEII